MLFIARTRMSTPRQPATHRTSLQNALAVYMHTQVREGKYHFSFLFFPLEKGQFPGNLQQCATVSREELLSDCDISQSLDWQHVKKCSFLFLTLMKFLWDEYEEQQEWWCWDPKMKPDFFASVHIILKGKHRWVLKPCVGNSLTPEELDGCTFQKSHL